MEVQRQEKEYFTDVIGEIEMLELEDDDLDDLDLEDESDPSSVIEKKVQYKIGDTFVFMDYTQASERAQVDSEKIDNKIGTLESKLDDINGKLQLLKTQLYAKFGDNINLERD